MRAKGRSSLRWLLRIIPTAIYLAVLILAGWLLYYSIISPYFVVREFAVSGNRLLDPVQARDAAGSLGENVLLQRPAEIEQSVRRISVVKQARAVLSLPGRLLVEVTERTPLVQWKVRETSFLVDGEGVVFSRQQPPTPLATVRDLDGQALEVGSRVDPGVLASVETLRAALPLQSGLRPQGFDYSRSSGLAVPTEDGPRVIFGDAGDLDAKLATLAALQAQLEATKARAELIDLRFKDRPLYVLVPPPAAAKPVQGR